MRDPQFAAARVRHVRLTVTKESLRHESLRLKIKIIIKLFNEREVVWKQQSILYVCMLEATRTLQNAGLQIDEHLAPAYPEIPVYSR